MRAVMPVARNDLNRLVDELASDEGPLPGFDYDRDWKLVKTYEPIGTDGKEVKVYVLRSPARTWRVVCEAEGIDLATGSGQDEMADQIARAIAEGMLGVSFAVGKREVEVC